MPRGCVLGSIAASLALTLSSAFAGAPACNTNFNYTPDFGGVEPPGLTFNGDAEFASGQIILTYPIEGQSGSVWHTASRTSLADGFDTTFNFYLSDTSDGIAFVLQDEGPAALGGGGSDMGYAGISRSLAIEFDTFCFEDEFPCDHISIQTRGVSPNEPSGSASLGHAVLPVDINDNTIHTVRITYIPGTLAVYFDNATTPILVAGLDLTDIMGDSIADSNGCMLFGFTGGTGGATAFQVITAWSFSDIGSAPTVGCNANFNYTSITNPLDFSLVGDAAVSNGSLVLTESLQSAVGAAWYRLAKASPQYTGFVTEFGFTIDGTGDGMAFVLQNESLDALGDAGSGMGYASNGPNEGITSSLAVEIDTFCFGSEFACDHVSIQTNGPSENQSGDEYSIAHIVLPFDVNDNQQHVMRIEYSVGSMEIYVDGHGLISGMDLNNLNILDPEGCIYVGFTAGNGAATARHQIDYWNFAPLTTGCEPATIDSFDGASGTIAAPGDIALSVTALGTEPLNYQWYRDGNALTDGGNISGANSPTLIVSPTTVNDTGQYDIEVSNDCGSSGTGAFMEVVPACSGDADHDGDVDFADITAVLTAFNFDYLPGTGNGDADATGIVNFADITAVLTNFGSNCD